MSEYKTWSEDELEILMDIAIDNSRVFCILDDSDVKRFYKKLISKYEVFSDRALMVQDEINDNEE